MSMCAFNRYPRACPSLLRCRIKLSFLAESGVWKQKPLHPSSYWAKKIWKTLQVTLKPKLSRTIYAGMNYKAGRAIRGPAFKIYVLSFIQSIIRFLIASLISRVFSNFSSCVPPRPDGSLNPQWIFCALPGKMGQRSDWDSSHTVMT